MARKVKRDANAEKRAEEAKEHRKEFIEKLKCVACHAAVFPTAACCDCCVCARVGELYKEAASWARAGIVHCIRLPSAGAGRDSSPAHPDDAVAWYSRDVVFILCAVPACTRVLGSGGVAAMSAGVARRGVAWCRTACCNGGALFLAGHP